MEVEGDRDDVPLLLLDSEALGVRVPESLGVAVTVPLLLSLMVGEGVMEGVGLGDAVKEGVVDVLSDGVMVALTVGDTVDVTDTEWDGDAVGVPEIDDVSLLVILGVTLGETL